MTQRLRLGTRGSQLAVTQSGHVAEAVTRATGVEVELVIIKTKGDRVTDRPLQAVGGKGLFTKEIEDALLAQEVDFAVHSMKDMPTENPEGLVISTVPERVDPRDALVGGVLADLPSGAKIGTGSVRRALQLRLRRPDLEIAGIRGNVDTRIAKQRAGEYDAIVLAMAGLTRLGRADDATEPLAIDTMIPAVGQGALAVQCRREDASTQQILAKIHDERSAICVEAERAFLTEVSGGCSAPAACHARLVDGNVVVSGVWAVDEHGTPKHLQLSGDPLHVETMGRELAQRLMSA
ncbi:MAG: hydroxymethylbilane synthase [Myxococcota bacterium]